ncbi:hypothetical protein H5410_016991 [Solanum commersonii]|uniref:Uncharacterized protein n=1 Tax=Solanum commersonii TaxID=4109 RepID=A0A9J5ZZ88_SOLCO|nr:hypothetical protein H5410_016991 [Solanum commersonii]
MKNAELAIQKQSSSSSTITTIDLMKVLNEAFWNTKAKGSSTVCILSLFDDTLHAINVGDSGSNCEFGGGFMGIRCSIKERFNVSKEQIKI